uniref:Major capsid protein L1 n=1 Tax=Human papillomavirus TaxID=10566 RepID=A0A385PIM4_9PAPI|nr:MAG: L1 protein [Human papillomavirus]
MALWERSSGKIYLPPARPVARVYNTDEYVVGTSLFFHSATDRLLTVGHPYFEIRDNAVPSKVLVPKVSGNQFRVFRCTLPDPNKFALIEKSVYNPESERLVWRLRGIEVGHGGPLGIGTSGHPLFNKFNDTENPNKYFQKQTEDNRQNISFDPKQVQLLMVGCTPPMGEHWDVAKSCAGENVDPGSCPAIQLVNDYIQDGDMFDIGLGAVNFGNFQRDRAGAPLDINTTICKWPDLLKMSKDVFGDSLFFYGRREQGYARHFWTRAGTTGDTIPEPHAPEFFLTPQPNQDQINCTNHIYFGTPSGSLVSSESQLLNRPYWLQRAQGTNNGICWRNELFVTVADNTHNTNFTLSVATTDIDQNYKYKATDFKHYLRHVEEYEIEFIFQLCKIPLEADILAHINAMNPGIIDDWQLAFVPPPPSGIEDTYRYINSLATRCPDQNPPAEKQDPYKDYNFWDVDLTERFSSELSQFSLGRRFLYQTNLITSGKRPRTTVNYTKKSVKRKRTK